jgi:lon-related putative ATP-dependent protease
MMESDAYRSRRNRILEKHRAREMELMKAFEKKVLAEGFVLIQVGQPPNPDILPLIAGEQKNLAELEEMVAAGKLETKDLDRIKQTHDKLTHELQKITRQVLRIESELAGQMKEMDAHSMRPLIAGLFAEIRDQFRLQPVLDYLNRVEDHILSNVHRFAGEEETDPSLMNGSGSGEEQEEDVAYQVNLFVDNARQKGPPVIVENAPTLARLFGLVERAVIPGGEKPATHMRIKPGSLHCAHGGYLVLNGSDLFTEPAIVWNTLKRTLRTGKVEIPGMEGLGVNPPALKPEPVLIDVKVVLIGDMSLYSVLYSNDDDFQKIFKIRADFDTEMDNVPANVALYGSFVERLARDEELLSFDRTGLARLAEHGARLAGRQDKLSTRFHLIADMVREASFYARKEKADVVSGHHVERAVEEKTFRGRLAHDKLQEMIQQGLLFIDVEGKKVGQVNGLSVYDVGDNVFGVPVKITATVGMGTAGIINIEREAELSGRTHDKGMQILAGYLRSKYAQDKPLTLTASVCFEQSYSGVDGDSASSTEIYALLSALSGIPLRQDIAVTGSVNQNGDIQPIGDVNEKIEGFFDVCMLRGLTGSQGVLIPNANLGDLMLNPRIVEAARLGQFHVHGISTIDEGIAILTEMPAGDRRGKGRYPRDTVNGKVDARLRELATHMRDYGGHQ